MTELTDQAIRTALFPYGFSPDGGQCGVIRAYLSLLLRWNKKISLTAVVEPLEILRFHFGESILAASSVQIEKGRLADVGSGAGFPGLALAIVSPQLCVTLIESNSRKSVFLSELVRELKFPSVEIIRQRFDQMSECLRSFDYITVRALGRYESLLPWAHGELDDSGKIVLWLGEGECRSVSTNPSFAWREQTLIPGSKGRFILVGSPIH